MGFEHSIDNMFFIPLAIFEGADISWATFVLKNLIPATLGNIVGGAFFVGTLYWYAYTKEK
jgi:formate/nitrite transporter FocA (FNT family)